MQLVGVGLFSEQRRTVIVLKGVGNGLGIVLEIEHEAIMLLGMCAV